MSDNGIYFLHWSAPMVLNYSGQSDKPVAYADGLGAILIKAKGEWAELPNQYQRKMRSLYNQVKMSAPNTRAVIIDARNRKKTDTRKLFSIIDARADEASLSKRKRNYGG